VWPREKGSRPGAKADITAQLASAETARFRKRQLRAEYTRAKLLSQKGDPLLVEIVPRVLPF
jgi:hypothetical protein